MFKHVSVEYSTLLQYLFNYPTLVYPDFDYPVHKKCEKNVKNLFEKFFAFLISFWVFFLVFLKRYILRVFSVLVCNVYF